MKWEKSWAVIVIIVGCTGLAAIYFGGQIAWGKSNPRESDRGVVQTAPVVEPPSWHYVTNILVLTPEWSLPAMHTVNGQHVSIRIIRGLYTECEARDINQPERAPVKCHQPEIVHTDAYPIYDWQLRVNGRVISGPAVAEFVVGTWN